MAQITGKVVFEGEHTVKGDGANTPDKTVPDTLTLVLDPIGSTAVEHELLRQFFTKRSVTIIPLPTPADDLSFSFSIEQPDAMRTAQRAAENRLRLAEGRPTVEVEEAQAKAAADAQAAKAAADKAAQAAGFANAKAQAAAQAQTASEDRIAAKVAEQLSKK